MKKVDCYNFFSYYKTSFYQKNKEKLLNQAKEHYKITQKYFKNNQEIDIEINTENYLMKKNVKKQNMEEIYIKICLNKIKKYERNTKKIIVKQKNHY